MLQNRLAKLREERANGEHGFTLIELLVVVVIIGILIAIAIPLYLNYKKGAADKATQSDVRNAINVLEQCNTDGGNYPTAAFTLTASGAAGTCTAQTINTSAGTTLAYVPASSAGGNYSIEAYNTNGNTGTSKFYCYTSAAGGQVTTVAGTYNASKYQSACTATGMS